MISLAEAFTAAGRQQPADALRHARAVLAHADAVGISFEGPRGHGRWPCGRRRPGRRRRRRGTARVARLLPARAPGPDAAGRAGPGPRPPGREGRTNDQPPPEPASPPRITRLRDQSTPYHLAHGLLDHATYLLGRQAAEGAEAPEAAEAAALAVEEARDIAARLRCQPLLDRAGLRSSGPNRRYGRRAQGGWGEVRAVRCAGRSGRPVLR